jgi:hypothetical protein|tara:strand:- start:76 stop:336 length:261 start_codon:yes stop_codon:yes gene_type:complete
MNMRQQDTNKKIIEFKLVDDEEMPPIVITMDENDLPKVVLNRRHQLWLSVNRKTIGGCAEELYGKIDELLSAYLEEQRSHEKDGWI